MANYACAIADPISRMRERWISCWERGQDLCIGHINPLLQHSRYSPVFMTLLKSEEIMEMSFPWHPLNSEGGNPSIPGDLLAFNCLIAVHTSSANMSPSSSGMETTFAAQIVGRFIVSFAFNFWK